jgi:hypothetical protein
VQITRLGFTCTSGPVSISLATQTSGQITGQQLIPVGIGSRGRGRLVANASPSPR